MEHGHIHLLLLLAGNKESSYWRNGYCMERTHWFSSRFTTEVDCTNESIEMEKGGSAEEKLWIKHRLYVDEYWLDERIKADLASSSWIYNTYRVWISLFEFFKSNNVFDSQIWSFWRTKFFQCNCLGVIRIYMEIHVCMHTLKQNMGKFRATFV